MVHAVDPFTCIVTNSSKMTVCNGRIHCTPLTHQGCQHSGTHICMNMHTRVTTTTPLWPTCRLVFQESEIHLALVKKPDPQDDRVADSAVRGGADGWVAVR